jgi:ABC-2 type transport system permease protein
MGRRTKRPTLLTDIPTDGPLGVERSARTLIARYTARRTLRPAVLWGYVFGVTTASQAFSYTHLYKTVLERTRLAVTFGQNHAASVLFGAAPKLQTVAGFTWFKASMTLMIIGAVWGLLTSTRLLRGEEDAGRWEMLLTGQTTRSRGVGQVLVGLLAPLAVIWTITALAIAVVGQISSVDIGVGAALDTALALVSSAAMFLAVGAVTSQLAPSRRQAAGYAAIALGLSYGVRMVADAGAGLHWLLWASPLGWVEAIQPLTHPHPWVFLPIATLTAFLTLLSMYLAGRRDLGSSTWPDRTTKPARLRLLAGPTSLTLRLTRGSVVSWSAAVAVTGLLLGIVAKAAGTTIVGSSVQQVFSRLGASGGGTRAFLGIAFLIIAMVVAFEAAAEVSATRAEEAEGRLDAIVEAPVTRSRWFVGRLAVATGALLIAGVVAGTFVWIGLSTQGSGVDFSTLIDAGINIVAPGVFVLGIGTLVLGLRPRKATLVVYVVLGWSALIEFVGGFLAQNHWIADSSLFHHLAASPAVAPDWGANGAVIGLGLIAMVLGERTFRRRDLQGE